MDRKLSLILKYRDFLPKTSPEKCIPEFNSSRISITRGPSGPWATPWIDTFVLLKGAAGFRPRTILEIGSYLGVTARLLAENTGDGCRVYALDLDKEHGRAYRGLPVEGKITRLVGKSSREVASYGAPYDMVFIDGDHGREGALRDSLLAWELLSDRGIIFWHDYQLYDYFVHRSGAVPEALREFQARTAARIVSLEGTTLALYSRYPGWETQKVAEKN
jgi:predicted O-methyltransferase YrrM